MLKTSKAQISIMFTHKLNKYSFIPFLQFIIHYSPFVTRFHSFIPLLPCNAIHLYYIALIACHKYSVIIDTPFCGNDIIITESILYYLNNILSLLYILGMTVFFIQLDNLYQRVR